MQLEPGRLDSCQRQVHVYRESIYMSDVLIGAHERSAGLIVVTNNLRRFERIPGLRIENWA
jgi:predicted nucleic acid-binding protein